MFKLFKTSKENIPTDSRQEVTVLESWTITWKSYLRNFSDYGKKITNHKVFIKELEADEFVKQLKESASFVRTDIEVSKSKN